MEERRNPDSHFTTMFDLYALPDDFPGHAESLKTSNAYTRVAILEAALGKDIGHPRFIPYVQLHEFEALLLVDPQQLDWEYLEHDKAIEDLLAMVDGANPEEISDGPQTAPSKRIISRIPQYAFQKAAVGPVVAEKIGLSRLRSKCRHFDQWLVQLERLL